MHKRERKKCVLRSASGRWTMQQHVINVWGKKKDEGIKGDKVEIPKGRWTMQQYVINVWG